MNAAPEIAFSSEQGKANYAAARRQYPAQAIVNLKTMRDNMAHLISVVGGPNSGTAVMGVVKADVRPRTAPPALAALSNSAPRNRMKHCCRANSASADRCRLLAPCILTVYNGTEVPFDELIAADIDVSVGPARHRCRGRRHLGKRCCAYTLGRPRRFRRSGRTYGSTRSRRPPAYTSRSIPASVATVSHRPDSTPRSPNSCRSPKRACCILWVSGAISPWPIRPMCPNSCPPPTARSKHSRTSRAAWNRPAFRRRSVTWPTRRPLWTARRFTSNLPAPASACTATSPIPRWAPRATGI